MKSWVARLMASVKELSPQQAALLLSVGLVLGAFPVLGCPTVLCVLAAFALRLNLAALQLVNNISSPLQLALALPLSRAGACLCGRAASAGHSAAEKIGVAGLHAIVGWACFCIPSGVLLYLSLNLALRRRRSGTAYLKAEAA